MDIGFAIAALAAARDHSDHGDDESEVDDALYKFGEPLGEAFGLDAAMFGVKDSADERPERVTKEANRKQASQKDPAGLSVKVGDGSALAGGLSAALAKGS